MPAIESASPKAGSVGGPSACPVRWAKPLIASARVPKPARAAYGPVWPKPVIRATHQTGVELEQHVGGEAPALEGAGPEVLDQHVGGGDQAAEDLGALGGGQAERDGALVARDLRPPDRGAVERRAVAAHAVAGLRVLDLDHLGAEVAEDLAGQGPGQDRRGVDDAEAGERSVGGSHRADHI